MCSKKISLQKSGNTDIIQNNVGCSLLRGDRRVMTGEHGGGNLVSTSARSMDNGIGLGDFFFIS